MATTMATLRTLLRVDLDEPTADRWSDDDLDRHIGHAVRDINRTAPREMKSSGLTIPDPASREVDISSLTSLINVVTVEYPLDGYPRVLRHFEIWGSTLRLLSDTMPVAGADVCVFYTAQHVVDAAGSTLPSYLEDLALVGAAGYAALEYVAYLFNRVTVGGEDSAQHLHAFANDRLMQFRQDLTALTRERQRVIRTGELWTEDER